MSERLRILIVDDDETQATAMAERLRRIVAGVPNNRRPVTMSFGICAYRSNFSTAEALIQAADEALYEAKRSGRNRVVCHSEVAGSA